jgi:hypothetical protein
MPFLARLAPPAPPEIAQAVEEAAARAGIRLDGVCQIDLPEANVYALPFARRIAFTRASLWKIDRAALLALAELEIGRLRTRRAWTAAVAILVVTPVIVARAAGAPMVAAAIVAVALAYALRRRPVPLDARFDALAAAQEPAPGAYARALAETHRLDLVPAVLRVATGQPNLHDRLAALGAPLPYPRPRAPSLPLFLALVVLAATASVAANTCAPIAATHAGPWTAAALAATDAWFAAPLGDLAYARHMERRYDEAAVLYGAAAALDPEDSVWPAHQCMSLAAAGRVAEAERALAEAERRGADQELLASARERLVGKR